MKQRILILSMITTFIISNSYSQINENEYVKSQTSLELKNEANNMAKLLADQNKDAIYDYLKLKIKAYSGNTGEIGTISRYLTNDNSGLLDRITNGNDAAVLVIYRNLTSFYDSIAGSQKYDIDFNSLNSIIFHKKHVINKKTKKDEKIWDSYLLGTKDIVLIYIDYGDDFYRANPLNEEKKLDNSKIQIAYHTSFSKQSFVDLKKLITAAIGSMGSPAVEEIPNIKITIVEINSKRIKDPCDIVIANKGFNKNLEFAIHDKNFSSFQVGIINNQYRINNFSLVNGNLVVKPDDTQKDEWKSNLYAAFEFHPFGYYSAWGRDIENFEPFWKDIFRSRSLDKIGFARWLKYVTIARIGVYGGLRINKDPLASLHAGFNYAITKELYMNFGWTWINEVTPQVTSVGSITSLDDALKYAKRSYSDPKFSWGLSFAPSTVLEMLGLKPKVKE